MTKLFPFKSRSTINLGLHSGAASGNLGLVKFALDNGQAIDSVVNGLLPIHAACAGGHTLVVKYLIERGADVNARRRPRRLSGSLLTSRSSEDLGSTALHFAAANGNVDLVHLLLVNGAQPTVVDKYGSTPLSVALAKRNFAVATLLQHRILSPASNNNPTPVTRTSHSRLVLPYSQQQPSIKSRSAPSLDQPGSNSQSQVDVSNTSSTDISDDEETCSSSSTTTLSIPEPPVVVVRRQSVPDLRIDPTSTPSSPSPPPVEKSRSFRSFFKLYSKTRSSNTITSCSSTSTHSLTTSTSSSPVV